MNTLSIVVPFYKRLDCLKLILSELSSQARDLNITIPVIVADSASVNNLDYILNESTYPNIIVNVIQTINSLSKKRNCGGLLAESTHIAFIDDDCLPSPSYLSSLLRLVESSSRSEIVSGTVSFPRNLIATSHYIKFRQSLLNLYPRQVSTPCKAENAYAMNFLVNRDVFLDLLFSETIKSYGWEDQEFFFRALKKGYVILNSNFHVYHLESSTFSYYVDKMMRYGYSLRLIKVNSNVFFESLSFSSFLSVLSAIPLPIIRPFTFGVSLFISALTYLLVTFDRYFLSVNLFFVFRYITRLAFLVGYLRPPSSMAADKFI